MRKAQLWKWEKPTSIENEKNSPPKWKWFGAGAPKWENEKNPTPLKMRKSHLQSGNGLVLGLHRSCISSWGLEEIAEQLSALFQRGIQLLGLFQWGIQLSVLFQRGIQILALFWGRIYRWPSEKWCLRQWNMSLKYDCSFNDGHSKYSMLAVNTGPVLPDENQWGQAVLDTYIYMHFEFMFTELQVNYPAQNKSSNFNFLSWVRLVQNFGRVNMCVWIHRHMSTWPKFCTKRTHRTQLHEVTNFLQYVVAFFLLKSAITTT